MKNTAAIIAKLGKMPSDEVAERHAAGIRDFWAQAGYEVEVRVIIAGADKSDHPIYGVRSNLVNGLPPGMRR